jgi:hypothetical protein
MKRHMRMNLRGFLRNTPFPRGFVGVFQHDDGRSMTPNEAHDEVCDHIAKGHNFIPLGTCDNFDYVEHGCLGHPDDTPAQPVHTEAKI